MVAHAVTSLGNNLHNGVNIGDSCSISLDLKTFYTYIIKYMLSYEFIMLTHKMIINQLHTSSIDSYFKHAHLYNFRHWIRQHTAVDAYFDIRISQHVL